MTVLGGHKETLLAGLSSFWRTLFVDKDQLNVLYEGTEELLGQAYLDLLTEVLNVNVSDMPLFNKEYWHLLTVRKDQVRFDPTHDVPYYLDLDDPLVSAEFLLNQIYDPTWSWERGEDFEVERGQIRFYTNPFEANLQGVARRSVRIDPTTYREGDDGVYTVNTPDLFEVKGLVKREKDGETFSNRMFRSLGQSFSSADIGRRLLVFQGGTTVEKTIASVVDEHTVRVSNAFVFEEEDLSWEIRDTEVFTTYDEGDYLVLENPSESGDFSSYQIREVTGPYTVKLDREIEFTPRETEGVPWTHQSAEEVEQLAFWVPDAYFDLENLYWSFGYLINRRQPSSESYRALIRGIFQFFMLGPALSRIESALNVMVGVPVVGEDGEVVEAITPDEVRTDRRTYTIPTGSAKQSIEVGDVLTSFDPLTDIFTVTDSVKQHNWMHGKRIPEELLQSTDAFDANVDPGLYTNTIGGGKSWRLGDPYVFIGADFDGESVSASQGHDLSVDVANQQVVGTVTKFMPHHVGRTLTVDGHELEILSVSGPNAAAEVSADAGVLSELDDKIETLPSDVLSVEPFVLRVEDYDFKNSQDTGMVVRVFGGGNDDHYTVTDVLDLHTIKLTPVDESEVPHEVDDSPKVTTALEWRAPQRAALRHNPGYNLAHDFLKHHVCYLSYDLNKWDIPHLQPRQDIREVIQEGTPSHVYVMFAPDNLVESFAKVRQDNFSVGVRPTEDVTEENGALSLDGSWTIGDYYQYTTPDLAWTEVIRPTDLNSVTEIHGADQASEVVFTTDINSGYIELRLYTDVDGRFVATGQVLEIGPEAGQSVVQVESFGKMAVFPVAINTSSTDAFVTYGVRTETPTALLLNPTFFDEVSGEGIASGNLKSSTYDFHAFDLWRVIDLTVDNETTLVYIRDVVTEDEVSLARVDSGEPFMVPEENATATLLAPQRVATPLVVGGANPDTTLGNLKSWPVLVNFAE